MATGCGIALEPVGRDCAVRSVHHERRWVHSKGKGPEAFIRLAPASGCMEFVLEMVLGEFRSPPKSAAPLRCLPRGKGV